MAKQVEGYKDVASQLEQLGGNLGSALVTKDLVDYADIVGKELASRAIGLKTSQIRKILDAVKRIEAQLESRKDDSEYFQKNTLLLLPQLAYAAGKQPRQVQPFFDVLSPCMKKVQDANDFETFARFVESIVAYHKFYGGRE